MVSQYLQSLQAASWIGSTILLCAMLMFAVVVVRVCRMNRHDIERMERLPLDGTVQEKNP